MLDALNVMIVEDDPSASAELAFAIDHMGGRLTGPLATVAEALSLLDARPVDAAIVDANLIDGDVTPLALRLIEKAVPFVVYTGTGLPAALVAHRPDLPVVLKPTSIKRLLAALLEQVDLHRPDRRVHNARAA